MPMYTPLSSVLPEGIWPEGLLESAGGSVLDKIAYHDGRLSGDADSWGVMADLSVETEAAFPLPLLAGLAIVVGSGPLGFEAVGSGFTWSASAWGDLFKIRFPRTLLKPVIEQNGKLVVNSDEHAFSEIALPAYVSATSDGEFDIVWPGSPPPLNLPKSAIGDTGIIVEAQSVILQVNDKYAIPTEYAGLDLPESWRGVLIESASVTLPAEWDLPIPDVLTFERCAIGGGGFSGTLDTSFQNPVVGKLGGMEFHLESIAISLVQNALVESALQGQIKLPFFDHLIAVTVSVGADGSLLIALSGAGGLYTLDKPGILKLTVESLSFSLEDGLATCTVSGLLQPQIGGLNWPGFKLNALAIDSAGNVRVDGGWFNLPAQYSLDFFGFKVEITRLGLGKTADGGRWIGCSGGVNLVDGLPVGGSVDGLRITWYDDGRAPALSFDGVGVEFAVPGVLKFKGAVSYRKLSEIEHRFDGAIKLDLEALNMQVDGQLVIGHSGDTPYFAIYLAAELPAGIPLWATGLGIYGFAGLFAINMKPNKAADEEWYDWYKRPAIGVTDLANKWDSAPDYVALGAGVTLGTIADNGYAFSGSMMLGIIFPGPVLLIEGKGNILQERAKKDSEPLFRALAVIDGNEGTFFIGLDAKYRFGAGGELLDIHGGVEAFFDVDDASAWHLKFGEKEPREKRIRAKLFQLFEANSYFTIDAHKLETGAWVGYDANWNFGPLRVVVQAWMETNVGISWQPPQFHGDLWLHGGVELSVFGFGLGMTVDAKLSGDVFTPMHILGELSVGISLPWPLPDFDVDVSLEWGPQKAIPALPQPLQDISIEHLKSTATWQPPRSADGNAGPPPNLPTVPLDARPKVTFRRPVADPGKVGNNAQLSITGSELIGDPAKDEGPVEVTYALKQVALHAWEGGAWVPVADSLAPAQADNKLYGAWAPIPKLPDQNAPEVTHAKLMLWSKSAFDYTSHGGAEWSDWFRSKFPGYPCITLPEFATECWEVAAAEVPAPISSPWPVPGRPLSLTWAFPETVSVKTLPAPVEGLSQAMCFPASLLISREPLTMATNVVMINLGVSATKVKLVVSAIDGVQATAYDSQWNPYGPVSGGKPGATTIEISGKKLRHVALRSPGSRNDICLLSVCVTTGPTDEQILEQQELTKHLQDSLATWEQQDDVFKPDTTYRLTVTTQLDAAGRDSLADFKQHSEASAYAFFKTDGPPGLAALTPPPGQDPADFASGLDDLRLYVRQTVPPTVAPPGELPRLPRPVYRGYDIGVAFNENYVDLMYRSAHRDLGLYLYDNNNRPVRDIHGRIMTLVNRWGKADTLTLTLSEELWLDTIDGCSCAVLDSAKIATDTTLITQAEGQILAPDTLYQARLVPLLLHEDFAGYGAAQVIGASGQIGRWKLQNQSGAAGSAQWKVEQDGQTQAFRMVEYPPVGDALSATAPGTTLIWQNDPQLPADHADQPASWTDYRVSAYLRSDAAEPGAVGLFFRHQGSGTFYRFALGPGYRRLVRATNNTYVTLAEDQVGYAAQRDYLITIEVIGTGIRVYQDGALIMQGQDSNGALTNGSIGLYSAGNQTAAFGDVRVDDFRTAAPLVYQFSWTTSRFTNFCHHIHSFQDETWRSALPGAALPASLLNAAVALPPLPAPPVLPNETESRAYEQLSAIVLGAVATQAPPELRVTRIERDDQLVAFHVHSPEPLDWSRTTVALKRAAALPAAPTLPQRIKISAAAFASADPAQQTVTLLIRDEADLSGYHLEWGPLDGPADPPVWKQYYTFGAEGLLAGGVRVRVHGQPPAQAPAAQANTLDRFGPLVEGQPQAFPAAGVRLRLIAPDGTIEHCRTFLPAAGYADLAIKVLRNGDGTGLVVVPPAAALAAAAGSYQLCLVYRRNNTQADPQSLTLSEAGNTADEEVTIDIPWTTR